MSKKGIFPYKWGFTLLWSLRDIFFSPKQLIRRLSLNSKMTVLEVGCGPGYFSGFIANELSEGKLVISDIQEEMLSLARKRMDKRKIKNIEYYLCDGYSFSFENNRFDVIFLVTVIGEVENKDLYIAEFYRILKPDGLLSITEFAGDSDKMSIEEVKGLVLEQNFSIDRLWGSRNRYTINFRKK